MTAWVIGAVVLPLLVCGLALTPAAERLQWRLLPWLPLPALGLALLGPDQWQLELPGLLLGASWQLDPVRQPFLLLTALLWGGAGLFAFGYVKVRRRSYALYWGLTLAGNLGLVIAADLASFYSFFALMTFAAYGLVVHERNPDAFRAGRVYLIMAVLGEMALLAGLLWAAKAADSLLLADLPAAIATSAEAGLTVSLLLAGFGVKAGLPLLHFWLPLAHPVAPTPASAVLSGAMIKAGLLGWLLTLPLGVASFATQGTLMVLAGALAALGGALIGVCQQQTKTVLAYSSISQMGLMTLMLGVALAEPARAAWLVPVIGLYALHHGLAKGALFLSTGVPQPRRPAWHRIYWLLLILPGLSLAGLPLTSGAFSKLAMKQALQPAGLSHAWTPWLGGLLSAAAVVTLLLILRFLWLQRQTRRADPPPLSMRLGWLLTLLVSLVLFHWLTPELPAAVAPAWSDQAAALITLLWPPALALVLAGLVLKLGLRAPPIPAGDLVVVPEAIAQSRLQNLAGHGAGSRLSARLRQRAGDPRRWLVAGRWLQQREPGLRVGLAWLFVLLALVLLLGCNPVRLPKQTGPVPVSPGVSTASALCISCPMAMCRQLSEFSGTDKIARQGATIAFAARHFSVYSS